jgi:nucleoside-diphosphate-sugar epimerase
MTGSGFPHDSAARSDERRVLVTGAAGRLGTAVRAELLAAGYAVRGVDRAPIDRADPGGPHLVIDGTNVGELVTALRDCDAIVHLGAIPAPNRHPDQVVFANNTQATFAVLQAAAAVGIQRVVVASSASILGHAWGPSTTLPSYAPVDEDHPLRPLDPYALSKVVDETSCRMFAERYAMSIPMLRITSVLSEHEAAARARDTDEDPLRDWHRPRVLWSYVDIRDAARAFRIALAAPVDGARAFNITAADTLSSLPTSELLSRYAPGVQLRRELVGRETAWSLQRAEQELGYRPEHSWRRET